MEDNYVTLETAKRLKAAGFPQETVWLWRLHKPSGVHKLIERVDQEYDDERFSSNNSQHIRFRGENEFFAAPTAQELADQLPDYVTAYRNDYKWWTWDIRESHPLAWNTTQGPTMVEALALLWIKLQENTK